MMEPAVDAHLANSTITGARARIQGLYSAAGIAGRLCRGDRCTILYALNFRLPLFAIGVLFGVCVIVGGILVHISESRNTALLKTDVGNVEQKAITAIAK